MVAPSSAGHAPPGRADDRPRDARAAPSRRPRAISMAAALLLSTFALFGATAVAAGQAAVAPADTSPPDTVTYREALRLVLRRNTDVRRAQRAAALAGTEATQQAMDFLPSLQLSSGVTRTFGRSFSQQEGEILSRTSDFVDVGGSASLELFNGFEKWASLERAQHDEAASRRQVDRARRTAIFQVVDRFATLLRNRELTLVAEQELKVQEELLRQVRGLVEVGRRPKSDLFQQQAARAEAEVALVEARRQERIAETELIRLLQLDPTAEYAFRASGFPDSVVAVSDSFRLEPLMQRAFEERSDLDAARRSVEARRQGVRAAESGNWPSVSLSFDYGSDWSSNARRPVPGTGSPPETVTLTPDGGGDPVTITVPGTGTEPESFRPDFFDQIQDRRGGAVRLSMSVPLFDRFQTRTQIRSAQVQLDNARYDLRDQRQAVAVQVRQALLDYRSARAQMRATRQRLQAARRAREAARRRYELGAATFVELTQAISDFVSARSAHVQARYSLVRARELIDYQTGTLDASPGSPS